MKFRMTTKPYREPFVKNRRGESAFTLAEILAAMVFMAIVIPVAIQGVQVASRAGEMAHRKTLALRVAEEMLNETIVTGQANQAVRNGTLKQGPFEFKWAVKNELWKQDAMRQVTSEVKFQVQGEEYSVALTTLVLP